MLAFVSQQNGASYFSRAALCRAFFVYGDNMSKELGIRLFLARKHNTPFNHRQVADRLSIERSTYTKYENGDSEPPINVLIKIKKLFNISCEELLERELTEDEIADYNMLKYNK